MSRLAVVTPLYPNRQAPYNGLAIYQTLRAMKPFAEIEIFCPTAVYPETSLLKPRSFRYHHPQPADALPDFPVHYLEYYTLPLLARPLNGLRIAHKLQPVLRRFRPDLILAFWIYPDGFGAVSAARPLGVPVAVASRGSDLRRIPDPITKRLVARTVRLADLVLTVSAELGEHAARLGTDRSKLRVIPNGCDTKVFHPASRSYARSELSVAPESKIVLYVGRLASGKGLFDLTDAAIRLIQSHPNLHIVFVGDGPLAQALQERARLTEFAQHFLFPGPACSARVARWLAAADLFCLPSHSEGCPNVVVEALACGRPVVATSVGGIPEMVDGASGMLVPPGDVDSLATAIQQALARSWDAESISRRASRTWAQVGQETWNACRKLLRCP